MDRGVQIRSLCSYRSWMKTCLEPLAGLQEDSRNQMISEQLQSGTQNDIYSAQISQCISHCVTCHHYVTYTYETLTKRQLKRVTRVAFHALQKRQALTCIRCCNLRYPLGFFARLALACLESSLVDSLVLLLCHLNLI